MRITIQGQLLIKKFLDEAECLNEFQDKNDFFRQNDRFEIKASVTGQKQMFQNQNGY